MIHASIKDYLPSFNELFIKHKIKTAYLFGSVLTDRFNSNSDVDFLVSLQEGVDPVLAGEHLWELEDELVELLNRKVDVLTERSLKNPFFIKELNETKVAIYGA